MNNLNLEEKIKAIKCIKKFGQEELGLDFGNAFEEYTDVKNFGWLYVTPKYKLNSIFKKPYRFYTDMKKIEEEAGLYSQKGFDTHNFLGEAMGNNRCPITPSLLDAGIVRQTFVILHEGWHITNTRTQTSLEEATGNIVGEIGTKLFLEKYYPELKEYAEHQSIEWRNFSIFINSYYNQLKETFKARSYAYKKREKMKILKEAAKERGEIIKNLKTDWVKDRYSQELNNAYFYRYHFYCIDHSLVDMVYNQSQDLNAAIKVFKQSIREDDGIAYLNHFLKE